MIQDIATQAAPVAKQVGAKAAELAAIAATKAGPFAQKAADVTTEYGQKFADRATAVAAELAVRRRPGRDATARTPPATRPTRPATRPATSADAAERCGPRRRATPSTTRPTRRAEHRPDAGSAAPRRAGRGRRPFRILAGHDRSTHRDARRPAAAAEGRDRRQLRQAPPRAPRRPDRDHARRARRGPRGAAARASRCAPASSRSRTTSTSSSTRRSSAPTATTATSRAACRSRATWPTSRATRRCGSSPRTGPARRSRSPGSGLLGRALQHELDHLDGKLYIDYLDSMDELIAVGQGDDEDEDAEVRERDERARVTERPPGVDRVRTVFLGSGAFAVPILQALAAHPAVDARRRRHRAARGPPAAQAARSTPVARPRGAGHRTRADAGRGCASRTAIADDPRARAGAGRPRRLRPDRPRRRCSTCRSARSTSIRRCCPGTAARRRSRPRSSPATRDRRDADAHGRGPRHGPDRRRRAGRRSTGDGDGARARGAAWRPSRPSLLGRSLGPWLARRAAATAAGRRTARRSRDRCAARTGGSIRRARPRELERRVRAYLPWPGHVPRGRRRAARRRRPRPWRRRPRATSPGVSCGDGRRPALATADGRLVLERGHARRAAARCRAPTGCAAARDARCPAEARTRPVSESLAMDALVRARPRDDGRAPGDRRRHARGPGRLVRRARPPRLPRAPGARRRLEGPGDRVLGDPHRSRPRCGTSSRRRSASTPRRARGPRGRRRPDREGAAHAGRRPARSSRC